jgi:hypothetical protein
MRRKDQINIPVTIDEDNLLKIASEQADLMDLLTQGKPNWKLVRQHDGLTKHSVDVMWLEWNDEGTFKAKHDKPAIGRSLIMSPFNQFFTWQTTSITEILEEQENYVKFKTRNSNYELWKLKND